LETFGDNRRDISPSEVYICTIRETNLAVMQIFINMDEKQEKGNAIFVIIISMFVQNDRKVSEIVSKASTGYCDCLVATNSSNIGIEVIQY
jgi:hypothetical protein